MIHRVSPEAGSTNTLETSTWLAQQIQQSTNVIRAQLPRSRTREETVNKAGRGTIIVSLLGNGGNIGVNTITLFNRSCQWERARPDRCNSQCFCNGVLL